MRLPTVAIVAHDACTVRVSCAGPAELRLVDASAHATPHASLAAHVVESLQLPAGLYHLDCPRGVGCTVIKGNGSVVMVIDGEDPWPLPPPPQFSDESSYRAVGFAYFTGTPLATAVIAP